MTKQSDEWTDKVLERLAYLILRTTDLHAADAYYHKDGRSLPGDTKKQTSTDIARSHRESLMKELLCQRSHKLDSVWLMERYVELDGKQMRRSTIIIFFLLNRENVVVLSERNNRSVVFFCDSNIVILNVLKDDYADDNLEAALNMMTTHIKKECSLMEYNNWTYSTKISNYIAAIDAIPEITKETVHW